jgi:hypothetical protein
MDTITQDDINRMRLYVNAMQKKLNMGEAISRGDFAAWAKNALGWTFDKIESGWSWIRSKLGL